jgi:hypothetical protein
MSDRDDDITSAIQAKSDQLNAVDIVGSEPVIKIREVKLFLNSPKQKVWIHFEGDNNRPWKPAVGMLSIMTEAWGKLTKEWVGKHVQIFCEPTVTYGGEQVGGIEIKALSDIKKEGIDVVHVKNQKQRKVRHIPLLVIKAEVYPADRFEKALPVMTKKMQEGEMTLQQVIAQCQKTGQLTTDQLAQLEAAAPVEIDNSDDNDTSEEM